MKTAVGVLLVVSSIAVTAAAAQTSGGVDSPFFPSRLAANLGDGPLSPSPVPRFCASNPAPATERRPSLLAVVLLPGSTIGRPLTLETWNYAPESIELVILDGFDAFAGRSLGFESAVPIRAPAGSYAHADHPALGEHGAGPLMLHFDGPFADGCAAFHVEADQWGNEGARATVASFAGTEVRVIFANGLRGIGVVEICRANGRLANAAFKKFRCTPGDALALVVPNGF